jgi:hypothetical protein
LANNLTLHSPLGKNPGGAQIVGIHKLIPSVYGGPRPTQTSFELSPHALARATHDVHFTRSCLRDSEHDITNPNYDVGILFGFDAASAINRPSHSKALIHDNKLYYRMSHSDLYGQSRDVTPGSKIEGRLVQFFRLETNQSKIDLVFSKLVGVINF